MTNGRDRNNFGLVGFGVDNGLNSEGATVTTGGGARGVSNCNRVTCLGDGAKSSSSHHEETVGLAMGLRIRIQQGPMRLRLRMKFSKLDAPAPKILAIALLPPC
jgi:hypothetical protein